VTAGQRGGDGDAKATGYGASAGKLIEFTNLNWPKGAMLLMDIDPHYFYSECRFVGGHPEVDSQLPDSIVPPSARPLKTFNILL
jgi:hypothetical protein